MKRFECETISDRVYVHDSATGDTVGDFENLLDATEAIRMHRRIMTTRSATVLDKLHEAMGLCVGLYTTYPLYAGMKKRALKLLQAIETELTG